MDLLLHVKKDLFLENKLKKLAEDIEKKISNKMLTEIESRDIGEMVMERLKEIDEISYVRFASVYRAFKDINTFLEEIKAYDKINIYLEVAKLQFFQWYNFFTKCI